MCCWRPLATGVEIAVKVTPRSGKADVAGVVRDAAGAAWLDVRVTAAPEGGRATKAAMQLVAQRCGVPPSSVELLSGGGSRWKRLRVTGATETLVRRVGGDAR